MCHFDFRAYFLLDRAYPATNVRISRLTVRIRPRTCAFLADRAYPATNVRISRLTVRIPPQTCAFLADRAYPATNVRFSLIVCNTYKYVQADKTKRSTSNSACASSQLSI